MDDIPQYFGDEAFLVDLIQQEPDSSNTKQRIGFPKCVAFLHPA